MVPDGRRRGRQTVGKRDDQAQPGRALAGDQAPRPARPSGEPAARTVPAVVPGGVLLPGRRGRRPGRVGGRPVRHLGRPGLRALVPGCVVEGRCSRPGPGAGRPAGGSGAGGRCQRRAPRRRRSRARRERPGRAVHRAAGPGRAARRHPGRPGSAAPSAPSSPPPAGTGRGPSRSRTCTSPRPGPRAASGPGARPSRGRRGRGFRRTVSGIPTARFRGRLVQMTANAGLHVIVADPAYTSRWGAEHWLAPLREHHPETTGHHAAALVLGRRGLGHRARRSATGNRAAPEDAARPAQARTRKNPAARPAPRKPATPPGPRQPPGTKTRQPHRTTAGNQAAQDRPGPPDTQDQLLLSRLGTVPAHDADLRHPGPAAFGHGAHAPRAARRRGPC